MPEKELPAEECWCCRRRLEYFGQPCPVCAGTGEAPGETVEESLFKKLKIDLKLLLEES